MNSRIAFVVLGLVLTLGLGLLYVTGCGTSGGPSLRVSSYAENRSNGQSAQGVNPPQRGFSLYDLLGTGDTELGIGAQMSILGDIPVVGMEFGQAARHRSLSLNYTDAPGFDLNAILRGSRTGANPFQVEEQVEEIAPPPPIENYEIALNPADELWIIVPADEPRNASREDFAPASGCLITIPVVQDPNAEPTIVPVPLEHTEVTADITGFVASVEVSQRFHNPFSEKIEAIYVFPLPQDAAVNGFVMTIGDRTIRGVIRKREEAEQVYQAAKAQGYRAAVMHQERPNVFTQKVANIEPGEAIDIDITYFHTLAYVDGWFEYRFPMVVGPRFNPPASGDYAVDLVSHPVERASPPLGPDPADQVATHPPAGAPIEAVARGPYTEPNEELRTQYLRPDERSGHDIAINLTINAGVPIEEIRSNSHELLVDDATGSRRTIRLAEHDTIPNKDFVLRYRVAGDELRSGLIVQRDEDGLGGHFAMMLVPPRSIESLERAPVEFIFVLDCSGSMRGVPLKLAKDAVRTALDRLGPSDSFQIIRFSENATSLGAAPLEATPRNIQRGIRYLNGLNSGGGTMMIEGIKAALDFPHDPDRLRFVTFLTDGYIGNEAQILAAMEDKLGAARVFSFGIGSSPNRFLIERMGRLGRGAVAYVGPRDNSSKVMDLFFDRVSRPAMTDVAIDFGGLMATDIYPSRIPDLFVGRPVVLSGRFEGDPDDLSAHPVSITGVASGQTQTMTVHGAEPAGEQARLDAVWARAKIGELANAAMHGDAHGERREMIEQIALHHGLMSAFTSLLAVDSAYVTEGESGVTVKMPVPVPEGVRYDTTVGGGGS